MIAVVVRGVILAAGASSRMGRPKAALPLTDRADTFLHRLIRTFLAGGVPDIVVVTGCHPVQARAAAGHLSSRVTFVHNDDWTEGQLSSLNAGLQAGSRRSRPLDIEAAMVTLVDMPLVAVATVAAVLSAWRTRRAPIVRPARGSAHGHPVIFDRALFSELARADPLVGAKTVVRAYERDILNVPVDDEGAFLDIDTEADYRAWRERFG